MAKKYLELVKDYEKTIAQLKRLHEERETAEERFESLYHQQELTPEENLAMTDAHHEAGELDKQIQAELHHLDLAIEDEYADVPYEKPRRAGIKGFWRESGLAELFPGFCGVYRR